MENEEKKEILITAESDRRKEMMNRVMSCAVYIVLAAGCFSFGYWIGTATLPEPSAAIIDEAVMNTNAEVMAEIWYEVCVEGNRLGLYRVGENERALLASEEISAEVFPYDDRERLEEGLIFEGFEAAQASFEDFVS